MGRSSVTGTGLGAGEGEGYMVTTPIYYVNGQPHLGHAYTSVVADIICRFNRNDGKDVFFLTGTDEHGQKVEQSAVANNKTPLEFADAVSGDFRALAKLLNCSNDDFIRTTEERHKAGVAALWKRLEDKGHIYLGAYEGWYSIRDEAYYAESELVDGKAPTGADVQWVKEESYFFRLSAFTKPLLDLYERDPDLVGPKGRRNEVVAFVGQEGGLQDLSISRTTFSWGVPVPGNPKHVVYVWLDALANYITAVGYPDMTKPQYNKYWPAALHIVGKDILRFHAVFWPAFLMAAELPLPKVGWGSAKPLASSTLSLSLSSFFPLSSTDQPIPRSTQPTLPCLLSNLHTEDIRPRLVDQGRREDEQIRRQRGGSSSTHLKVRPRLCALLFRVRGAVRPGWRLF